MVESNILKRVFLKTAEIGSTLFRNNVGVGWVGKALRPSKPTMMMVHPEDVLIKHARPLHAGLCQGSSDTIGWTTIIITNCMIGQKIAVFTAIEVKDIGGKPSKEQINFIDQANMAGAIAGVAYSDEDAVSVINKCKHTICGVDN